LKPKTLPRAVDRYALARKLAISACLVTLAAALLGFLDLPWPLELFAHLRVQYTGLLALLAITLAILRYRALACVGLIAGAAIFWTVIDYTQASTSAAARGADFRLLSYNVWFRTRDEAQVARYLEDSAADAIVLQEIDTVRAQRLAKLLPSYPHAYFAAAEPHGVALFTRWPILSVEPVDLGPHGSRASQMTLLWRDRKVAVLGVHLHWPVTPGSYRLRRGELEAVASIARLHDGPLLVTGDLNVTPWSQSFRQLLSATGLADCALGHGLLATWPTQFPPLALRIDHCLMSRHWQSVDVRTGPRLGSDHLPTIADLEFLDVHQPSIAADTGRRE
jgi:endonuclease/exonuclease/phosphatase (EEP) superfamily protein YafD